MAEDEITPLNVQSPGPSSPNPKLDLERVQRKIGDHDLDVRLVRGDHDLDVRLVRIERDVRITLTAVLTMVLCAGLEYAGVFNTSKPMAWVRAVFDGLSFAFGGR